MTGDRGWRRAGGGAGDDRADSTAPDAPPVAAFDPGPVRREPVTGAWIVTRWGDVAAALTDPRLEPPGGGDDTIRRAAAATLPPARVGLLEEAMYAGARRRAETLPFDTPVDLMATWVVPWAREVAATVCGGPFEEAASLHEAADRVFQAAARATGSPDDDRCPEAVVALARRLPGAADPQAFVALSGTLAALVGSAWQALTERPDAWERLRRAPDRREGAWDELLRYAGPARAVFRTARRELTLGGADVQAGDRVTLVLASANRDPDRFPDPHHLDLTRPDAHHHLSLGRGVHGCPGALLVRRALATATEALLDSVDGVEAWGEAVWGGGYAIRTVAELPVILRRAPAPGGVEGTTCTGR